MVLVGLWLLAAVSYFLISFAVYFIYLRVCCCWLVGFEFVFGLLFLLYLTRIRYLLSLSDFVGFSVYFTCLLLIELWLSICGCLDCGF